MTDGFVIAVIALATRLPYLSHVLWAWDSVLYARAVDDFHLGRAVLEQRPQPPGYILYIGVARFARWLLGDANAGLVAVSLVSGVLVVVVAYYAARSLAGRRAGLIAAAVALVNPVLWEASEIAYPYALLALLAGALAIGIWRASSTRRWLVMSAAFGIALGFRQDLAIITGPLWLIVAWRRGPREGGLGLLALLAASLVWVVPTSIAAGGLDKYIAIVWSQAVGASGLEQNAVASVAKNLTLTLIGLKWQLLWLWPVAICGLVACLVDPRLRSSGWWLALSAGPALVLYLALHIGEPMYTLSIAIPLAVAVAIGADRLASLRPKLRAPVLGATAATALAVAATFLVGSGRYSANEIARHDRIIDLQVAYVRENHPAVGTLILARSNFLHAIAYLPEYKSVRLLPTNAVAMRRLFQQLGNARSVVFLDDSWQAAHRTHVVMLPGNVDVHIASASEVTFLFAAEIPDPDEGLD